MIRGFQGLTARGVFFVATITATIGSAARADEPIVKRAVQVSGTGTDLLNGAIVHTKKPTATGVIQRGTEIVELSGDLKGKILYHVTTAIDTRKGTLVNTGDQVFSGTIAGSEPLDSVKTAANIPGCALSITDQGVIAREVAGSLKG
jgi:hypothetical protein